MFTRVSANHYKRSHHQPLVGGGGEVSVGGVVVADGAAGSTLRVQLTVHFVPFGPIEPLPWLRLIEPSNVVVVRLRYIRSVPLMR